MKQRFSTEQLKGFYRGNALKYIMRYDEKNGVDDLEKAADYIHRLIEVERGEHHAKGQAEQRHEQGHEIKAEPQEGGQ